MIHRTPFESLEGRRLFTFATLDSDFGKGGVTSAGFNFVDLGDDQTTVTPLDDGRLVVDSAHAVRYLKGDGTADKKRGDHASGRIVLGGTDFADRITADTAVDPHTGRLVTLFTVKGESTFLTNVEVRDAKGRVERTFKIKAPEPFDGRHVAFTSDGGFIVALPREVKVENGPVKLAVRLYRYNKANQLDGRFGINGRIDLDLPTNPLTSSAGDHVHLERLLIDAHDRIDLVYSTTRHVSGSVIESRTLAARASSSGALDSTWSTSSGRVLAQYTYDTSDRISTQTRELFGGVVADRDGALLAIIQRVRSKWDGTLVGAQPVLLRLNDSGTLTRRTLDREQFDSDKPQLQLSLSANGLLYVALIDDRSIAHVYRAHTDLRADASWSNFGDFIATTAAVRDDDFAVDAQGRLLFAATPEFDPASGFDPGPYGLARFDGRSDSLGAKPGSISLLPDGTLLLKGTTTADTIGVKIKKNLVTATVNGDTRQFHSTDIRGIAVQAGNGNDTVTMGSVNVGRWVEGQAGNDTLVGSGDGDTLIGSSGDDALLGNSGADDLYGQDGNDDLLGGDGRDELFGGPGNDRLFASGATDAPGADHVTDLLDGGTGRDLLRRDVPDGGEDDILGRIDAQDTVTGG